MITKANNHDHESGIITDYESVASEAIQKLQTNISFASPDNPIKVLAVTSAVQGEGKSSLVVNLANIYAFRGMKVCIVNLDIRCPSIHKYYHVPNKQGIVDYVNGNIESLDSLIVHTETGADIINSGTSTPFATKILESVKIKALIKELRERYEIVLVDTSPVLLVTDAFLCSKYVDAFLFVCTQHKSKKKDVAAGVESLRKNNIPVIGTVMTRVTDFSGIAENRGYYYSTNSSADE